MNPSNSRASARLDGSKRPEVLEHNMHREVSRERADVGRRFLSRNVAGLLIIAVIALRLCIFGLDQFQPVGFSNASASAIASPTAAEEAVLSKMHQTSRPAMARRLSSSA